MFKGKLSKEYLFSTKEIKKKETFNLITDNNFEDDITEEELSEGIKYFKDYNKWFYFLNLSDIYISNF